jgi:hypothetical protein
LIGSERVGKYGRVGEECEARQSVQLVFRVNAGAGFGRCRGLTRTGCGHVRGFEAELAVVDSTMCVYVYSALVLIKKIISLKTCSCKFNFYRKLTHIDESEPLVAFFTPEALHQRPQVPVGGLPVALEFFF